ncbi:hypothetical protein Tco_0294752 [Tanacetum coccineum]
MDVVVFIYFRCDEVWSKLLKRLVNVQGTANTSVAVLWRATNQWTKSRANNGTGNLEQNLEGVSDCNKSSGNICLLRDSMMLVLRYVWVRTGFDERCVMDRPGGTALAHGFQRIIHKFGCTEGKHRCKTDMDAEVLVWIKFWENTEHLDVDSCDSDSPKNVNNIRVSRPSSGFLRERISSMGWKVILWTPLKEGEFRVMIRFMYNGWCIKDCHRKRILEMMLVIFLEVHSQGDCEWLPTDE